MSVVVWSMTGLLLGRNNFSPFLRAGNIGSLPSHSYTGFRAYPHRDHLVRKDTNDPCTDNCTAHLSKSQRTRQVVRAQQWWSSPLSSSCVGYSYMHNCRGNNTAQGCSYIHVSGKKAKEAALALVTFSYKNPGPPCFSIAQWSLRTDFRGREG